jgi:hypothetical protein
MPKTIKLKTWAERTFGDDAPCLRTLLSWAEHGEISPPPTQIGKDFWIPENAILTSMIPNNTLLERMKIA